SGIVLVQSFCTAKPDIPPAVLSDPLNIIICYLMFTGMHLLQNAPVRCHPVPATESGKQQAIPFGLCHTIIIIPHKKRPIPTNPADGPEVPAKRIEPRDTKILRRPTGQPDLSFGIYHIVDKMVGVKHTVRG